MSSSRDTRLMSALVASGLWITAILLAIPTLRLALAESVGSPEALAQLVDSPVVGEKARETLFRIAPPADARSRVLEVSEILARRPLSAGHWLELARAQYEAGASAEKFFHALEISQLTGPNEGSTMAGRAVFGLSLWGLAAEPMRKALIRDLVGGWPQISDTRRLLLRAMFAESEPQTRREIAARLQSYGEPGSDVAQRLGLAAGF